MSLFPIAYLLEETKPYIAPPPPVLEKIESGLIFTNDFDDGTLDNWQGIGATWQAVNLYLENTESSGGGKYAERFDIDITRLKFIVRYKSMTRYGGGAHLRLAVADGTQGTSAGDGYVLGQSVTDGDTIRIARIDDGSFITLVTGVVAYDNNVFYRHQAIYDNGTLKVKEMASGVEISVTDTTYQPSATLPFRIATWCQYKGCYDEFQVFKDLIIKVTNLLEGQKVELYDAANTLKASDTVGAGETEAILNVEALEFPFEGYFKVYEEDGVTLKFRYPATGTLTDIWGGDIYKQT